MDNHPKINILLKEYDTLRSEVLERIKIAFSHLAYFGAVVAFALPASKDIPCWQRLVAIALAAIGGVILLYTSFLNWSWVGKLAQHLQGLEVKINELADAGELLTWERHAEEKSRGPHRPPT